MSFHERLQESADGQVRFKVVKTSYLGNLRFLGELYLHNVADECMYSSIMNDGNILAIIEFLISSFIKNVNLGEEDVEALCELSNVIGKRYDVESRKELMDKCFAVMAGLLAAPHLDVIIHEMIRDIIALRKKFWAKWAGNKTRRDVPLSLIQDILVREENLQKDCKIPSISALVRNLDTPIRGQFRDHEWQA